MGTNDIIRYNDELWISEDYLSRKVGSEYVRIAKYRARQGASSWQHDTICGRCYFRYASLPRLTSQRLGNCEELLARSEEVRNEVEAIVSRAVYSSFKRFLNLMNPDEARSAAVIHEAAIYVKANDISFSKSDFFESLAHEISLSGLKYLPSTWRVLRDKIRAYTEGTTLDKLVYAKNKGNHNSAVHAANQQLLSWLMDLGSRQQNYSSATIYRKIAVMCSQNGMRSPSQRWVNSWFSDPATQFVIQERYGAGSRFNHRYRSYTPTASALYAGDCWDIDGTRFNLIDHRDTVMKDGKPVTLNRYLYIVVVRDVMSGLPLGWIYCHEESASAVVDAIAMAVRNAGYLPYELRYDRFPGHNSESWTWLENELRKAGVILTETSSPNAKKIERWFGTLQSVFMSESNLYYGEGIQSTHRSAHRSKEYVARMQAQAQRYNFSFDDACREADHILHHFASTPYCEYSYKYRTITESPLQLHNACSHPNAVTIDYPHYCRLFGLRKELSIRNYMIQTQIQGAVYYYAVDDVETVEKYTGVKLTCCFDPENLEKIHLFDGDTFMGTFDRLPAAQQYGPNKDMRSVGKMKAIGEKMKTARNEKKMQYEAAGKFETISSEVGTLIAGRVPKAVYEASETEFLNEKWKVDNEDENLVINTRNRY